MRFPRNYRVADSRQADPQCGRPTLVMPRDQFHRRARHLVSSVAAQITAQFHVVQARPCHRTPTPGKDSRSNVQHTCLHGLVHKNAVYAGSSFHPISAESRTLHSSPTTLPNGSRTISACRILRTYRFGSETYCPFARR